MSGLAGVGGRVNHLLAIARRAERVLVIDGCPVRSAGWTLERADVKRFEHLGLQDVDLRRSSCPVNETNIARGVAAALKKVAAMPGGE